MVSTVRTAGNQVASRNRSLTGRHVRQVLVTQDTIVIEDPENAVAVQVASCIKFGYCETAHGTLVS
jgi:hypothetical protein